MFPKRVLREIESGTGLAYSHNLSTVTEGPLKIVGVSTSKTQKIRQITLQPGSSNKQTERSCRQTERSENKLLDKPSQPDLILRIPSNSVDHD